MDTKGREVIYISSDDDDNATAPLKPSASKPYYPTTHTPQYNHQQMMLPKPEPHAYHTYQTPSYHTNQTSSYHNSNMPNSSARTKQPKPEPLGYSASSYNPTMTPSSTKKRSSAALQSSQVTATPSFSSKKRSNAALQSSPSSASKKRKTEHDEEMRARRFRPHPPQAFHDVYARATSQKFFVLDRKRLGTAACPEEKVEMTGSTGNIYVVHIKQLPSCTCPHYQKGNQCKHWIWVMSRVLRAEFKHVYQLALLSEELRAIFAAAPPIDAPDTAGDRDRNRKPIEGDCPICYSELEEPHSDDNIVWCRAACGNNIHRHCFETWAKTKRGQDVTCPLCRSVWEGDKDSVKRIQKNRPINQDGYVNVADQLGISGVRDTSTYHRYGRYSRYYGGYDDYEEYDDY